MITKMIDTVTMEELWQGQTDGYIPILLDIYNPDIKWGDDAENLEQENMHLRIINDTNGVRFKGKKYIPCSCSFKPPAEDGTKISNATVVISNLDFRTTVLLQSIEIPCEVNVVTAFARKDAQFFFREVSHWKFYITAANATRTAVTFTLNPDSSFALNTPRDTMDRTQLNSMVSQ